VSGGRFPVPPLPRPAPPDLHLQRQAEHGADHHDEAERDDGVEVQRRHHRAGDIRRDQHLQPDQDGAAEAGPVGTEAGVPFTAPPIADEDEGGDDQAEQYGGQPRRFQHGLDQFRRLMEQGYFGAHHGHRGGG
jgi:hypothetical protein